MGKFEDVKEFFEKKFEIVKFVGDRYEEVSVYCNLGNVVYFLGNLRRVVEYYE